ncbi:nucleoside-diphosphate kinase [Desulfonatronum thioautotrophicum]|uniref:nucleoside-diphosphate kinase n=1 Tax=Desulfonatronum thioautotrophicum TaxID=617001 RepID=UPI0005EBEBC9|nr:nucleoside-diphosphate kinase [Desulfonatronum thioautotrophicum]
MSERTLCMIKPDGVERNLIGNVLTRIETAGLRIVALRKLRLTTAQAEGFYAVHKERPFFQSLVSYMTSGPIVAAVLEGDNAISRWRELMGATNPANAEQGTIRKDLALDVERNTVHGSDAPETAAQEIPYFFNTMEQQG